MSQLFELPRQAMLIEVGHEGIGIVLFHVPDAGFAPFSFEHLLGSDHGGHTSGVGNGLGADLGKALFVIADVIDVDRLWLAVLEAGDDVSDAGFALGGYAEVAWIGQHSFEELQRDDFDALVNDGIDAGHADVLQYFEVLEVVRRERHPKLRALDGGDVLDEGFELLVIHAIDFITADAIGAGEALVLRHGGGFDKIAVFEMAARCGDLADVDFWIEIGGKGVAVIAAVNIDDIERVNFIEVMLECPCGKNIGHAGIEARAEQRGESSFGEFFLIGPLPRVFELGDIGGLVVGGIEIINASGKASIHQRKILVGQGDIQHQVRLEGQQVVGGGGDIVGVNGCGIDTDTGA